MTDRGDKTIESTINQINYQTNLEKAKNTLMVQLDFPETVCKSIVVLSMYNIHYQFQKTNLEISEDIIEQSVESLSLFAINNPESTEEMNRIDFTPITQSGEQMVISMIDLFKNNIALYTTKQKNLLLSALNISL